MTLYFFSLSLSLRLKILTLPLFLPPIVSVPMAENENFFARSKPLALTNLLLKFPFKGSIIQCLKTYIWSSNAMLMLDQMLPSTSRSLSGDFFSLFSISFLDNWFCVYGWLIWESLITLLLLLAMCSLNWEVNIEVDLWIDMWIWEWRLGKILTKNCEQWKRLEREEIIFI